MMSPTTLWFRNTATVTLALTTYFLGGGPQWTAVSTAQAAQVDRTTQQLKALRLDARAKKQLTDFAGWKADEAVRTQQKRQAALAAMRLHTGAAAQEKKAQAVKKVAEDVRKAHPTASVERALSRAKGLKLDAAQTQAEVARVDGPLMTRLKTRGPPAVMPDSKPQLTPDRMTPVQLPRFKPKSAPGQRGGLTPEGRSLYAAVAGQGAEVLQDDGRLVTVEETLAQLSIPPRARRYASVGSDFGRLVLPMSALPAPTADDLLETNETSRSAELLALVQQLGPRPLDIYNFVHTQVVPQLYFGSKKGSAQTLAELQGNDFDQASLLIAMLRAAGTPARYEYGSVELSEAQAISLTGAKDIVKAAAMMSAAGVGALSADGTKVLTERAWVRAWVPYGDWRGTGPGGEKLWVRLDPALKETKYSLAVSVKGLAHFDFNGFFAQPTTKTPQDVFEAQLLAAAKAKNLCNNLDDAIARVTVTQKPFELLPAEHPAKVTASLLTFSRPPSNFRHLVDVTVDGVNAAQLELAELEGRALVLTFPGTTAQDVAAISAAGTMAMVSPQLVSVTPTLTLDGVIRAAFAPVNPGTTQRMTVRVTVPGGSPAVGVHQLVAGTPWALMVEGGTPTAAQVAARIQATANTTGDAKQLAKSLAAVASYTRDTEVSDTRVFGLHGQGTIKDVFIGVAGRPLKAAYVLGLPVALAEGRYAIDVTRDSLTPLTRDGDASQQAELLRWAGFQGSVLENRTWEKVLGGAGISAVKALQLSKGQGVPIYTLTPSSQSNRALLTGYTPASLADIDISLAAGWTATVPQHPINYDIFQNIEGYALENPVNGEGAYRLSAALNGGEGNDAPVGGVTENNPGAGSCRQTNSVCDLATGRWRESRSDLVLPAVGMPIVFSRTYSSRSTMLTPLGYGWMHSYGVFLRAETGGGLTCVLEDSREIRFTRVGSAYVAPTGWHYTLTDVAGGGHAVRFKDGIVWDFDATGALVRISEPSGNATTLVYASGRLAQVKDSGNQLALTFSYTGNKLTSVLDRTGRIVRFGHMNDDLIAATDVLNHTETYAYDDAHNLTTRTDKRGKAYVEFYDLQDRWVGYRDPLGNEVTVAYDAVNRRTVFTDRTGAGYVTEYNSDGNPTAQVDPLGNRVDNTWDAESNPLTTKDARGFTTTMTWDAVGNLKSRTEPDGITTTMTYEPIFSRMERSDRPGLATAINTFDPQGRVTSRTDGLGTTTFGYDAVGQLKTVTAPGAAVTTFARDAKGNVSGVTDATGRTTTMGYDAAGHLTSTTDGNNNTRSMTVDAAGRLLTQQDAKRQTSAFTYDDEGHRLTAKDPTNRVTSLEYDALGRMTKATDALGFVTRSEFDAEGRQMASIDAKGNRSTMKYDAAGRMVEMRSADGAVSSQGYCADVGAACARVDALGHVSTTTFDSVGRVTNETDALGRVTTHTYDFAGRPLAVTGPGQPTMRYTHSQYTGLVDAVTNDGLGQRTAYTYDARGNRTAIDTNLTGSVVQYTYDLSNRLLTEKNPLGTVTTYTYDAAGNRETKLDGNGQTTRYRYDANRRLTAVEFSDGTKYEYGYDTRGNRTLEKGPSHERQLAYDARSRVETTTDVTFGKTISYAYDENGNRASVIEGATTFGYAYDGVNRIKRADGFGGSLFFEYDAAGRRTSLLRPNGIRTTYGYDDGGQLLSLVHAKGASVVLGFTYGYDAHGMRTSKTREDGSREGYGYDAADRLVRVEYPTKSVTYQLDSMGNRLVEDTTSPGQPLAHRTGTFSAFNQQKTLDLRGNGCGLCSAELSAFAYDFNGNLLTETRTLNATPPGAVTTYGWDRENRLRAVTPSTGVATSYNYDANGLRTLRIDATGPTRYLLDGASVLEELDGTNASTTKYLSNPLRTDELLAYERGSQTEYPLADALGSLYASTGSTGAVVRRYDFDVYGRRTELGGGSASIEIGFAGRIHDPIGLVDYRDRQVDPSLGRWLQPDRLGILGGLNSYGFVRQAPTMWTDLNGNWDSAPLSFSEYIVSTWIGLTIVSSFFSGLPSSAIYGPDSSAVSALRSSGGYRGQFALYRLKAEGVAYDATFNIGNCVSISEIAGNPLTAIVGSYRVRFIPNEMSKSVVTVIATNRTSLTSLGHGIFDGPDELPNWDPIDGWLSFPLSNSFQIYWWNEILR